MIAATNRNPKKAVTEGKLREDLLYRLLVFPIELPPLRDRGDDFELLAHHFLGDLNRQAEARKRITDQALERLHMHTWPGNVRELKHVIERAFIMATDVIDPECLPADGGIPSTAESDLGIEVGMSISDAERKLVLATLERTSGDKKRAAEVLGISLKTLYNRLNAYKTT